MTLLSKTELEKLLAKSKGFCVSIYVPYCQANSDVVSMSSRLRNLVQKAEEILVGMGLRETEAATLLGPTKLLIQFEAGRNDGNGLVVFIAHNTFRYYRLPLKCEESVFVADRFDIEPLMPLVASNKRKLALQLN